MIFRRTAQLGVTLFEVMLVLAIAASMLSVGFQQYQSLKEDSDIQHVSLNVNTMFQALSGFYAANCSNVYLYKDNSVTRIGLLDPSQSPANPYPVNISTQLVAAPNTYIKKWPLPINSFIDNTATDYGYVLQFNLISSPRNMTSSTGAIITVETDYLWQAQVAVKLRTPANVNIYRGMLSADCTSTLNGTTVYPCSANKPGPYLVWARLPSLSQSSGSNSSLWISMPQVLQFKQQYTNDTLSELGGTAGATNYNLCGG